MLDLRWPVCDVFRGLASRGGRPRPSCGLPPCRSETLIRHGLPTAQLRSRLRTALHLACLALVHCVSQVLP